MAVFPAAAKGRNGPLDPARLDLYQGAATTGSCCPTMTVMGLLLRISEICYLHELAMLLAPLSLAPLSLAGLAGAWSVGHPEVSTDTDQMFAASLP